MRWDYKDLPPDIKKQFDLAEKKHRRMQKKFRDQIAAAENGEAVPAARKSKMGNVPTEVNGIRFDSKKEAERYTELLALERAGEIKDLRLQQEFTIQEGFTTSSGTKVKAIRYKADFAYYEKGDGNNSCDAWSGKPGSGSWRYVVEDTKGYRTEKYKIKKKLILDRFGIEIRET